MYAFRNFIIYKHIILPDFFYFYRSFHGLWLDMNFIHRVLFKSVGEGIGTISNKNHIQQQTMKDCLNCIFWFFLFQTFLPNDILNVYKQYHCICVGWTVRLACERLGVRIPAATDQSRKNRQWQLHYQTLGNRRECHGPSEMTII